MGTSKHKFLQSPIGILSGLVKNLMDKRKEVKLRMKNLDEKDIYTKIILDRRQNALKICANSVYGIMGFEKNNYFGHLGCAESITKMGRTYLDQIVNYISNNYPARVIYGDTDSCMVIPTTVISTPDHIQMCHKICEDVTRMLPSPMALNFDEHYDKIILMSKKRYIMYKDRTIKYKGVMNARRGYCQFAKNLYSNTVSDMMNDVPKDKIISNVNKLLTDLLRNNVPAELLSMTKSVKNLDEYKVEPPQVLMAKRLIANGIEVIPGTRLEYVFTTNGEKQGERMYMPEELARMDDLEVRKIMLNR
ncbi:hypothetical protein K7432_018329 [Basidiobolus ranarum]|uniref:DNA-directed DNA polymerase n=1 Tax=Basidiobolus ranarum TaxID=34480 RepID=A0ABR2VJB8_9FUNG